MKHRFKKSYKRLTKRDRAILYDVIEMIEEIMGGYGKARIIVKEIEKEFGLEENLVFKMYKMKGWIGEEEDY